MQYFVLVELLVEDQYQETNKCDILYRSICLLFDFTSNYRFINSGENKNR